ncbi:MAG: tryptophan--tRNA ligase [Thermoprotei archaeon]|nr:MAG: tryptophan--tRNA ligase [Thermoprotei archaeon]
MPKTFRSSEKICHKKEAGNSLTYNEKSQRFTLDPWSSDLKVEDYERLCQEFGIKPLKPLLPMIENPPHFLRRGIIFGHRDLELILEAAKKNEPFAVMSGIKPTGDFHLGTLLTMREIIYFQKAGGLAVYCIADIEAYEDNNIPFDESRQIAIGNIADALALGLDPKRAYIYRQSKERRVKDLAYLFGRGITLSTITAIYGERHLGLYMSALIQVADILLPQLKDLGGPKPTVVPVGIDQDPHIRFARDVAHRFHEKLGFIPPSSTYHRIMRGLDGSPKMSKRNPMSYFTLNEDLESIKWKLMNAYTGGRATAKEQRELGGIPEQCCIYELCVFYFVEDDKELLDMYMKCRRGEVLCGDCKIKVVEKVIKFIEEHQRRRNRFIDTARSLIEEEDQKPSYL